MTTRSVRLPTAGNRAQGLFCLSVFTMVSFLGCSNRQLYRWGLWATCLLAGAVALRPLPLLAQAPQPLAPASAPEPVGSNAPNYILGPGDQVAITVIGYEEFDGSRVVLPDGSIAMPLVGSVPVAGRTTDEVSRVLTQALRQYLVNPVVAVSLSTLRPVVVTVAGEVYRPGPIQLSSLTSVNQTVNTDSTISSATSTPTLSRALIASGGVKRTADVRQVAVRRALPNGQSDVIKVNLWDALVSDSGSADLVLRDGDAIYVPEATEEGVDPQILASSTLAPDRVRVRVVGEVNRPGEVQVPPNSSLSSAVAIAGGPNDDADLDDVKLLRLNEAGQVEEQEVDLSNLIDDVQIQDGDVVVVPKKGYLNALDSIGRVAGGILSPLRVPLSIFNLFNLFSD